MNSTVVIIEDDPDILELLRDVLETDGFRLSTPESFDHEQIAGACSAPGAFLIDLMLPRVNGVDLARQLRRTFPRAPMIAMSASRLMLEVAVASGIFQDHISKPFNLSTLLGALERCYPDPVAS